MAITSFPWASVDGDRPVTEAMDAAYFAGAHGNIVLYGLQPSVSGTDVAVSAGMAVVQGRVIHVDAPVTLTPTVNRQARVVLRLDLTNRTAEVALSGTTTSYPSLTRNGSTWEMGLGTADTTGALAVTDTRADFDLCGIYDTGRLTFNAANWTAYVQRIGRTIQLRVDRNASTAAGASQTWDTGIPSYLLPTQTIVMAARGGGGTPASANISTSGLVTFTNNHTGATATGSMSASYFR